MTGSIFYTSLISCQVSLADKRALHLDSERHRLIQQQVLLDYRRQPSQVGGVVQLTVRFLV